MANPTTSLPPRWALLGIILAVWAALFIIQLSGPPNLMAKDQERPASYIMDVVRNGNWIVQHDASGSITSKPPLYTWLGALTTLPFERINRFSLYLPNALATLGVALLLLQFGGAHLGRWTGFWAALMFLCSMTGSGLVVLARTDPLFVLTITAASFLAFRSWSTGKGWTWYWLVAAMATLAKGPLGVLISLGGLVAAFWEKRSGRPPTVDATSPPRSFTGFSGILRLHWLGLILFFMLTAGWFALAYWKAGQELIDKMLMTELVGQAVSNGGFPGSRFWVASFYFLTRFAPWSVLTCLGIWRVWKSPSPDDGKRRAERFLVCNFLVGLAAFSIGSHTRAILIAPLLPAGALLAAMQITRLFQPANAPRFLLRLTAGLALFLALWGIYYNYDMRRKEEVRDTISMMQLAQEIRERLGDAPPIVFVDTPYALQFYLNSMKRKINYRDAANLLSSSDPVYVAVMKPKRVLRELTTGTATSDLIRWPAGAAKPNVTILSNR